MDGPLQRRKMQASLPEGADNPLNAAVSARDRDAVAMASEAVRHKQCMLAFQPVMQSRPPHQTAFYEGFIRVLDATGRVIPARAAMSVMRTALPCPFSSRSRAA